MTPRTRHRVWTSIGILTGVLLLGALAVQAMGGRTGLLLTYLRVFMREDNAAFREIAWQQGPTSPVASPAGGTPVARPPNVILIVVDDLGFNDLTLRGAGVAGGRVPTRNIDALAQQGVSFDVAYSGNATCAPSRAAILTGRYATRFGFEFTPTPKEFMQVVTRMERPGQTLRRAIYFGDGGPSQPAYQDMGLPQSEITLARLLQGAGYHTAQIGKWHLGDSPGFRAYAHGFHESLSLQHGGSMFLPADDPRVVNARSDTDPIDRFIWAVEPWGVRFNDGEVFRPDRYLTDYLTDHAVRVIEANRHRPFFLYLAYNAPHTPLQAAREDYDALADIADHRLRVYAAMIRSLDRGIGRVMETLRAQGLDQDTLVIFTNDNGAPHYVDLAGLNAPLRGWKATYFEGGIRVPLFMRWPAGIPAGARVTTPVGHVDIFSTVAAAAGQPAPSDRVIDGVDLLPFARSERSGEAHQSLYWRTDDYRVLRARDWKLQVTERPRKDWLYDLAADPGERRNLAGEEPVRLAAMKAALADIDRQQAKPLWRTLGAGPIPLDKMLRDPQSPDDEYVYFAN